MPSQNSSPYKWRIDLNDTEWDRYLTELNGHPLQSALWGNSRQEIDNIKQMRWAAFGSDRPVWMARVEERNIPLLGKIAWIPRGPTYSKSTQLQKIQAEFMEYMRDAGYILVISDPWEQLLLEADKANFRGTRPQTIWINLKVGKEALWKNLDKQWRYGVNRAKKLGVVIECVSSPGAINRFYELCLQTSRQKEFKLPGSEQLMQKLLATKHYNYIESRLLIAKVKNEVAAGIFVIRCGENLHYFWGATDRNYSDHRVSEALQWHAMEWALSEKCNRYDLEGIDPINNVGVYKFKKKMGGDEITLMGKQVLPITWAGHFLRLYIK